MASRNPSGTTRWRPLLRVAGTRGITLAALILAFTGVGIGWAAWTTQGTGSGSARAITPVTVTVTTDTGQTADLYPGAPAGALHFRVDNANPYPVTFTSMTPGTVTVDSAHSGCAAGNVTVAARTGLSISVPANTPPASAIARSVASAVTMSPSAPDACQGAVFTIVVTLNGTSA